MAGRSFKDLTPCWRQLLIARMNEEGRQMAKTKRASETIESKNKALVLEAFETVFNKRDYKTALGFWSPDYIQHSAHIEPGRDGLFNLIKSLPPTLKYEPGTIVAEGEFVIVHGRFSNSPSATIVPGSYLSVGGRLLMRLNRPSRPGSI